MISSTKTRFSTIKGGIYRGRDEIDRIAGVIKATHPASIGGLSA